MNTTTLDLPRSVPYLVWFDTEYTSLDLQNAQLLQVAALITDQHLRRVLPWEADIRLAIHLPGRSSLSTWVQDNLPDLVTLCCSAGAVELKEADLRLASYIDAAVGMPTESGDKRPVLAGNSIHADWWLAVKYLPRFVERLHYRHFDVTTLKLEWQMQKPAEGFAKENSDNIRRYFPDAQLPADGSRHDAYYDIQASIAELAFYRKHLFQPHRDHLP